AIWGATRPLGIVAYLAIKRFSIRAAIPGDRAAANAPEYEPADWQVLVGMPAAAVFDVFREAAFADAVIPGTPLAPRRACDPTSWSAAGGWGACGKSCRMR
ncbi:MAG TPA: hypothetical protein VER37_05465, partial [Thermomicrobiales bacterium]|nr:hypothetical protein [Thermomicrobiales bacterium]